MSELTAENFVSLIKQMNDRDRNKLRAADLIGLIIQLPESPSTRITELTAKVDGLIATVSAIDNRSANNAADALNLKEKVTNLENKNTLLSTEVEKLNKQVSDISNQLAGIDQYLRINNIEIVGLPDQREGEVDETIKLEVLNSLNIEMTISPEDIDICHALPSQRKYNKRVHVCRFVSRKVKMFILSAKKTLYF